jgi:hypothetical protein
MPKTRSRIVISIVRATLCVVLELVRSQDAISCVLLRTNKYVINFPKQISDTRVHLAQPKTLMTFLGTSWKGGF